MKKSLVSVLIVLILTNFIFLNNSYAIDPSQEEKSHDSYTWEDYKKADEQGSADITLEDGTKQEASISDYGTSMVGTVVGILSKQITALPMIVQVLVTVTLRTGGIIVENEMQNVKSNLIIETDCIFFSIQRIIVGEYLILDADIFRNIEEEGTIKWAIDLGEEVIDSLTTSNVSTGMKDTLMTFRDSIRMWFSIIRDIAVAINLLMLLYIAIRVAISTVASDKAKYKEMLFNWFISMIILFSLQYIMIIINSLSNIITGIARNLMIAMEKNGQTSFENEILTSTWSLIQKNGGLRLALYSIIYWILVWTEIKFFTLYAKRMLTIFFLVIVSPIITVTYAVDKIADRKAQAFDKWLHEYTISMFQQPLHCFIYMIFMYMANNIAIEAPLVGVIFLLSLTKAEKIIVTLIGFTGVSVKNPGDQYSMKGLTGRLKKLIPHPGKK